MDALGVGAGGGLLGILVLDEDCVDQLYVDPASTGQRIGSRVLTLAKAQRPGGRRLWTFVSNPELSGSMNATVS